MPEDSTAAIEWEEYEETLCPGCGVPRAEGFDPANEEAFTAHAIACAGCAASARKRRMMAESDASNTDGVYVIVARDDEDDSLSRRRSDPRR